MPLQVVGVRHGEVHNPKGVIYAGLQGYGLSERGRAQAEAVAQALRGVDVAALYASPLDRAVETASYLSAITGAEAIHDIRLHEWRHWQQWAGLTWEELRTKANDAWEAYTTDPGSVTSGESLAELGDRVESWLSDVERDHPDGIVVAVTHLEPLRAILLRRLGLQPKELFSIEIGLCDVVSLHPDPQARPIPLEDLPGRLVDGRV